MSSPIVVKDFGSGGSEGTGSGIGIRESNQRLRMTPKPSPMQGSNKDSQGGQKKVVTSPISTMVQIKSQFKRKDKSPKLSKDQIL